MIRRLLGRLRRWYGPPKPVAGEGPHLTKAQWMEIDAAVARSTRLALRFWSDILTGVTTLRAEMWRLEPAGYIERLPKYRGGSE